MNKMQTVIDKIKNDNFVKSIGINLFLKPVTMLLSFIYTPILLNYLGEEDYGVWATLLSIINWVNICDIGIGNGLRNTATKDIAHKDFVSLKKTVSTAYVAFMIIISVVFTLGVSIGHFLNWNHILNTKSSVIIPLLISFAFICINFIIGLYTNGYYSLQKAEASSVSTALVQFLNLILVSGLTCLGIKKSKLLNIAVVFGFTKFFVGCVYSFHLWSINNAFIPSTHYFDRRKVRELTTIGIKFFLIQIAAMVLYTTDNLILTWLMSPVSVTSYSTVTKYFLIPYNLFVAMLAPFWSKSTEAKELGNFIWIRKYIIRFLFIWLLLSVGTVVAVPVFKPFARIWLGHELTYDSGIIVVMAIYYIVQMYAAILSTVLNGLGEINLSVIVAIAEMIVNIPLSIYFARDCGLLSTGVALGTLIPQVVACIILSIQLCSIMRKNIADRRER